MYVGGICLFIAGRNALEYSGEGDLLHWKAMAGALVGAGFCFFFAQLIKIFNWI